MAELLVVILLPVLLAASAGWDMASFTIPNFLTLTVAGAFLLFAGAGGPCARAHGRGFVGGPAGPGLGFSNFVLGQARRACRPLSSAGICWPACLAWPWVSQCSHWAGSVAETPSCLPAWPCGWDSAT